MSQHFTFMDCRGLSAPLTVLRIKQAMIGRAALSLPLDVVIDESCCDGARVAESLADESGDIRFLHVAETLAANLTGALAATAGREAHA